MQVSLDRPQLPSQKVKNILIRSSNKEKHHRSLQHPEISYILKYSPKYYQNLTIEISPFSPLLSKIKKVKKLKKLKGVTGRSFADSLFQKLWVILLANTRKEIEEAPEIISEKALIERSKSFWRKFDSQKIKFFPNVVRILLSKWKMPSKRNSPDPFLTITECFIRYIGNLKKLRSLEVVVKDENYEEAEWVIWKLNKMRRFLKRLEVFILKIETQYKDVHRLFNSKNFFAHLTGLSLPMSFNPIFAQIPQLCKNLNSFSFGFKSKANQPEFLDLLTSVEDLNQLKKLAFAWPASTKNFWGHFKPHANLRQLTLIFNVYNLLNEGLFKHSMEPKNVVGHWEEIQELDVLTFNISCEKTEDLILAKQFITMVLKKVRKVRLLKYYLMCPWICDEPFFVEEIPHLYDSLERFEYLISDWYRDYCSKIDLKMMKPFRNLKQLKLEGGNMKYENVEEVVSLLEENQKEGEASVLDIKIRHVSDEDWFGEILKKIENIKRADRNLRISLDLTFKTSDFVELLERLCQNIQGVKTIKGLVISLTLYNDHSAFELPIEILKKVLDRYAGIRNWKVSLWDEDTSMGLIKLDGEKVQFYIY